jgi:crossover junction endodeoxyribonuclease RuvC
VKILGIDPGTTATGYGVVEFSLGHLALVDCGVLRPPASAASAPAEAGPLERLAAKLRYLKEQMDGVLTRHDPDAVAVETIFSGKNAASAVTLAHARGVLLLAVREAAKPVFEYQPLLVKQALVGYGRAEKRQVRAMVLSLLARNRARIPLDAADALAVAITHCHCGQRRKG